MYSYRQLRKGLEWAVSSPKLLLRELNRVVHTRGRRRQYNPDGVDLMAADWDNLLLLDACRYDVFEEVNNLPGELAARESRAAHTSEFILGNLHQRELLDTVYVTASPMLERSRGTKYETTLHATINVWKEDGWDEETNTVLPETMVEYTLRAAEEHPRKRLLVHFIQPHYPFIDADMTLDKRTIHDPDQSKADIWTILMQNQALIDREELWCAYRDNLKRALPHVEELMTNLVGKTVVTSDHGNMFGERARPVMIREWGHPVGIYTPKLVTVPWLEHVNGPRREIVAEEPDRKTGDARVAEEAVVADRLQNLGYVA
jgi:hypothetical protein